MKILIFGATGSAGGSVLRACLASHSAAQSEDITRRPLHLTGDRLHSFIHQDFCDYTGAESAFAAWMPVSSVLASRNPGIGRGRNTAKLRTISRSLP